MRTREFPVLSAEDEPLVRRLALSVGDDTARVLAYLLRRRTDPAVDDGPADRLSVRIGTGLNRTAVSDALGRLERRGLVDKTTVETEQGRPPDAWVTGEDIEATIAHLDEYHAADLLSQSRSVADELGTSTPVAEAGPGSSERSDSSDTSSTSLTVGLNWFANVLHAPLFAARAEGAYARRGVEIAIEEFAGSDRAIEAIHDGTVDVAVAGAATITRARGEDVPLVPLAPLYQRAMTVLYTTHEAFGGPLDGIESVRGRRIGMPVEAETGLLGRLFLSQSGIVDDVTVVDLSGEESDALATGEVDVVSGSIGDVRELEAEGRTVDVLSVDDHFPVYGPTLVTTEAIVTERTGALTAFLAATIAGWRTSVFDPEVAVRAVEAADGRSVETAVADLEHAIDRFGSSAAVADHGWGWHETAGWQRLSTALAQVDLLGDRQG
jgi:ABC-type nitrate/sulfonate/bicarbonate transport system substrate-binding protein